MKAPRDPRRQIPSVDALLREPAFLHLIAHHGRTQVLACLRDVLHQARTQPATEGAISAQSCASHCAARLQALNQTALRPVFNLSGVVLHTNLGRSPLPATAIEAVTRAMAQPITLEYDLDTGSRGKRDQSVESLLQTLTGAEAALVVNNNAAAVFLALNTLASGRETLVSRGELVEIGGSFRIPDILRRAGTTLVEVGTTNRTHLADYEAALTPATAVLMKVHASNYRIQGYTCAVDEAALAPLAHRHGLPLITDLGSGSLIDLEHHGLPHEPTPREKLAQGADLVTFSGDKLLGGPQAGLIVGRKAWVEPLRRNPLKRALRAGKMTLAALEAVLRLYLHPEAIAHELPTLRLLTRSAADIQEQAERLLPPVRTALGVRCHVEIVAVTSQMGSGSLPTEGIQSHALKIGSRDAQALARAFRALPIPVIGRVHDGSLYLDLRCLDPDRERAFLDQLALPPMGSAS
ncbi:MAG TPA: L-seryl-tRNA(Sec) selenium transferase [Castellaniella sp.]|uniref:L-seryl-tRNA(Sec) selenium transferase n=1 Tax=Castellaniella sp. TaxID=1955812 RepID=UPI002F24F0B5